MNKIEALIFDVDGTLAQTERDGHRPAFNAAFADAGLAWHWDEALYGRLLEVAGGKERIRRYAQQYAGEIPSQGDLEALVRRLHAAKTTHYLRLVRGLALRPGIPRLLEEARSVGVRLAIATTTSPENVDALLRAQLGPDAPTWFEVIGAGDVVAAKKPAPDIYLWVLERLGVPATACLAIEDSAVGLRSAREAGLETVVTPSEYTVEQEFCGAAAVLTDLSEVSLSDLQAYLSSSLTLE